ncbi:MULTISPECIES: hypothetical protein [unclassified Streptomyces]|uniref:hypothetical protein n=1 Tax=unclassified Streptomyces TaxID=2593676 RepID=UPI00339069DD
MWHSGAGQRLATVAHEACRLRGGAGRRRIRALAHTRPRLSAGRSRSGSRRWCDRLTCGGRAGAAA